MPAKLSHVTIFVADAERSLRFWRDGMGLEVSFDREIPGNWPDLFGVASKTLRAIFLGDTENGHQLELVSFAEPLPAGRTPAAPVTGTAVVALSVDLAVVLPRLRANGATDVRETTISTGAPIASVRDPDGVLVELMSL